jgi:sRNA-binding carbon storage regulator CsrA
MLVLTRNMGQTICIGREWHVTPTRFLGGQLTLRVSRRGDSPYEIQLQKHQIHQITARITIKWHRSEGQEVAMAIDGATAETVIRRNEYVARKRRATQPYVPAQA